MAVQFVTQLLIARQLVPDDYGVVGMISIFLGISYIFIESGFGTALVQKKDRTQTDYSTVFYFNVSTAVFLYFVLFFSAPFIAKFYNEPLLIPVTRLVSLGLIINALVTVQYSVLYTKLDFKTMSIASIYGVIASALVGLSMAYSGFGMWSLVAQNLSKLSVSVVYLWIKSPWRPSFVFSKKSFISLWPFGSKLLLSGLVNTAFDNLYQVVIGKLFSKRDLGLYSKSMNYSSMPMRVTVGLIGSLVYPALCSVQDDTDRIIYVYRKYLRIVAFIMFPLMFGLAAIAKPLVIVLLTVKWVDIVPLIQVLCFATVWGPITSINHELLLAKGRSDLSLRLNVINKIITVIVLVSCIPLGLIGMCFSQLIISILTLFVNTHYTGKFIGLTIWKQMVDIYPSFLLSLSMAILVYGIIFFIQSNLFKVIVGVVVGVLFVYFCSAIFKIRERDDIIEIIKNIVLKPILKK